MTEVGVQECGTVSISRRTAAVIAYVQTWAMVALLIVG